MNAKDELLKILKGKTNIKCAFITDDDGFKEEDDFIRKINLKLGYSPIDLDVFLKELDFSYDSGYGGQRLFGVVWLTDGTWLERGEYDGSEWWEHKQCPDIPEHLL